MKKFGIIFIVLLLIFNISGCAALQKKFTRKKKTEVRMPRIYQVKKYEKRPTPELYEKHYSYWVTWQSELLQRLGKNHKKDVRCIEEILSNLQDMQNMLVPEKAKELAPHIEKLMKVRDIILRDELDSANKDYVRMTLEREDRAIKRYFHFDKVKNYLKKSLEEEGEDQKIE